MKTVQDTWVTKCPKCGESSYMKEVCWVALPPDYGDPWWVFDEKKYRLVLLDVPRSKRIETLRWLRKEFKVDLDVAQDTINGRTPLILKDDVDSIEAERYQKQAQKIGLPIQLKEWKWNEDE